MATSQETNRREAILEAAAVVISERGVDAARMADVAEQAGVSLGLVQHYFRHRERLLSEVFRHELDRIARTWTSLVDQDSPPLERVIDYLALCVPVGFDSASREFGPRWGFWLELWSKAHRDPATASHVPGVYASFAVPFGQAIEQGVAEGQFGLRGEPADTVARLVAMVDGLAVQTLIGGMAAGRMLTLLVDWLAIELGLDAEQGRQACARAHDANERLVRQSTG